MASVSRSKQAALTAEKLRHILHYDPETGVFTWMVSPRRRTKVGDEAGNRDYHGYVNITHEGTRYRAHRLAWLYMTGEWPADLVDHKDQNRSNNRWLNLRPATKAQNGQNTRKEMPGVHWISKAGRWNVRLMVAGKVYKGGWHACKLDAVAARMRLERLHCTHSPRIGA